MPLLIATLAVGGAQRSAAQTAPAVRLPGHVLDALGRSSRIAAVAGAPDQPVTVTVVLADAAPAPLVTTHVWLGLVGCASTLAACAAPLASCVMKVNAVALGFTGRFAPPFSWNLSPDPVRPAIVPPIV